MKDFKIYITIKNFITKIDLYKKEQAIIITVLLCFAFSGITIPLIKEPSERAFTNKNIQSTTIEIKENKKNLSENQKDVSKTEKASGNSNTASSNNSNASLNTNTTKPQGTSSKKTWIPPVYKTVHHDAVYETRRMVICNYCSETFDSTGEFQIHKDANGG